MTHAATTHADQQTAVLIVSWNSGAVLLRTLDCLARQTRAPHRVIVVDNASTDGSIDQVRRLHPHVQVVVRPTNDGFARANNVGVEIADDCEWIALLNPDAFPEPEWLAALLRAAQEHPECASFGSHMRTAETDNRLDGLGDVYHVSGAAWRDQHAMPEPDPPRAASEIFSACAAAALYRRDVFREAGGFDESFFCYFEDVDLGFRLRLLGHRCLYVPGAVVRHVGSASFGDGSDFAIYHGGRNIVWTFFKDMPTGMLLRYLPQHLLWNVATLCVWSLRGRVRSAARSKRDALRGLPAVLRQRRAVQSTRRVSTRELRRTMAAGLLTPYLRKVETRRASGRSLFARTVPAVPRNPLS